MKYKSVMTQVHDLGYNHDFLLVITVWFIYCFGWVFLISPILEIINAMWYFSEKESKE